MQTSFLLSALVSAHVEPGVPLDPRPRIECFERRWYAAYTRANHEKTVTRQLQQRSVECFLPLYERVRRWKDRRMRLQLPLFPSYVFVRLALGDRLRVLEIPGVARLVGFDGRPVPLPEGDIETIRTRLAGVSRVEPYPYLRSGRRVRILSGALEGLTGVVVRKKNRTRFVISLELIMRSVAVEIDDHMLGPAS